MKAEMVEKNPTRLLVDKAQAGERVALDRLVEKYRSRLQAGVEMKLQSLRRGDIEPDDVLQETFVRAFQSIDRFEWQGEDSFYLWLSGIVRNVIFKAAKKPRKGRILQLPEQVAGNHPSPSKAMQRDERFDRLEKALANVSAEYREVLRLARLEGLKIKEVAVRMNRSENAVRHLLARAVIELRKSFGDTESLRLPDRALRVEGDTDGEE